VAINKNTKKEFIMDKIDEKILESLIANSRSPLSTISKHARISKQGCYYRMKKLEAENIITGYRVKINSSKLGFSSYCLYLKLININESSENELIEKIISKSYVRWFVTCTGRWDIMIAFSSKDNLDYNNRLKELLKLMDDKVLHYETSIILSTNDMWLRDRTAIKTDLIESDSKEKITLDEKNRKILEILQTDCRTEVTKIAPQVNLTAEAVSYRIKKLQKDNIIHSFTVSINKEKFGLTWYQIQFLLKNIDDSQEKKILSKLKMIDGVDYIVWMIGKWNFEINMYCKTIEEFRRNLMTIRTMLSEYIREYDTNIILKKYKSRTLAE
jgi:DNA-binding Lrp family transcriptional regulator